MKAFIRILALAVMAIANIVIVGCSKNQDVQQQPQSQFSYSEYTIQLGEQLYNPYLLQTMQTALEELVREGGARLQVPELAVTHLYVRFLPETKEDLEALWNLGEELYLYPLDYEIKQWGLYYKDPFLGEDDYPYVYAVVPADFVFPQVRHDVLAQCYIPNLTDDDVEGTSVSGCELEWKAFEPLYLKSETKSGISAGVGNTISPNGSVTVDTCKGNFVPLRGAKVRCRTLLREAEAVLSDEGTYSFNEDEYFVVEPTYSIVYTNEKGFSLWYNLLAGASDACVDVDSQTIDGFNIKFSLSGNSQADSVNFALAAVNNSVCDYLDMCKAEGILPPPEDLKIWVMSFLGSSSASMIRRVAELGDEEIRVLLEKLVDFASRETDLTEIIDKEVVVPILQELLKLCEGLLPDLTIGANTRDYSYGRFYSVTWHELTHSSHFSLVGPEVWKTYIYYILDYGCYGDGSAPEEKRGICDLGESWAYANEHYCGKQFGRINDPCSRLEWFFKHYQQLDKILNSGKMTRGQMYWHLKKADGQPCLTFNEYLDELNEKN